MAGPTSDPGGFGGEPEAPDRRRDLRLVGAGIGAVLLVWFALANLQDVTIHFWVSSSRAPLILVVIISAFFGMLTSFLVNRARRRREDKLPPGGGPGTRA